MIMTGDILKDSLSDNYSRRCYDTDSVSNSHSSVELSVF